MNNLTRVVTWSRVGGEPETFQLQVQHSNHYVTVLHYMVFVIRGHMQMSMCNGVTPELTLTLTDTEVAFMTLILGYRSYLINHGNVNGMRKVLEDTLMTLYLLWVLKFVILRYEILEYHTVECYFMIPC